MKNNIRRKYLVAKAKCYASLTLYYVNRSGKHLAGSDCYLRKARKYAYRTNLILIELGREEI